MTGEDDTAALRARFAASLDDLRGRHVTAVDYWDVHNYGPGPAEWDFGDWHHAVMGLQLSTDRGPVTVTWTATFYPYGVEALPGPITDELAPGEDGPERVGPDGDSRWPRYLGTPILDAVASWERLQFGPARRADGGISSPAHAVDLPVAIRIDFPAGPVWFVAGMPRFPEMDKVFIPADEIMVVFTREKMLGIGFPDSDFLR